MNNLFELLKVQTISTFKLNKLSQFGKAKKGGFTLALVFVTALMVGLIGGIGYFYSMTFAQSLALINRLDLLFPLMISFCALVGLVFSFYTFLGSLYSTKEYNFLSAGTNSVLCPITASPVFLAWAKNSNVLIEVLNPYIDSSLSIVPPVCPSPLPDIFASFPPREATVGAIISVVLSPTPPVLCLSTL